MECMLAGLGRQSVGMPVWRCAPCSFPAHIRRTWSVGPRFVFDYWQLVAASVLCWLGLLQRVSYSSRGPACRAGMGRRGWGAVESC